MQKNKAISISKVLYNEGGYVNNPKDPGGATNMGITQKTLDEWMVEHHQKYISVQTLTTDLATQIYAKNYWDACKCDSLSSGIDYLVFDAAVNTGITNALKMYQQAYSTASGSELGMIHRFSELKTDYYLSLKTFSTFGKGWLHRVLDTLITAVLMSRGQFDAVTPGATNSE